VSARLPSGPAARPAACKLFAEGVRPAVVARRLGVSKQRASRWHATWRAGGADALASKGPSGSRPRLSDADLEQLAEAAYAEESSGRGTWHAVSTLVLGVARLLLDEPAEAEPFLQEAADVGHGGKFGAEMVARSLLAHLAAQHGQWDDAVRYADAAASVLLDTGLGDTTLAALTHAARSQVLATAATWPRRTPNSTRRGVGATASGRSRPWRSSPG
jgi:Winged helix-turn helix